MMTGYEYLMSLLAGDSAAAESADERSRLVLYPDRLRYREFLSMAGGAAGSENRYLPYSAAGGGDLSLNTIWKTSIFLRNVWRWLDRCGRIELFFLSPKLDWTAVSAAAAVARLKGVPAVLHDFSFLDDPAGYRRRLLRSLCLAPEPASRTGRPPIIAAEPYQRARKVRAVPHVIVVADSENERMRALARRAYELVKQKYPRTIFTMIGITDGGGSAGSPKEDSLTHRLIAGEADLLSVFADGDMVLLLSPGGINDLIAVRARTAGFPIIVNGFGFVDPNSSPARAVVVPRDSYSALAEAVIRLVDDDGYYRSFASG